LEASVRVAWNEIEFRDAKALWPLVAGERDMLNGERADMVAASIPGTQTYFGTIEKIRHASMEAMKRAGGVFESDIYAVALSFHLFKLCGMSIWDQSAKVKLFAALLASSGKLRDI
jgi:phage gp37-like protein